VTLCVCVFVTLCFCVFVTLRVCVFACLRVCVCMSEQKFVESTGWGGPVLCTGIAYKIQEINYM
jgi:hypothetical protein